MLGPNKTAAHRGSLLPGVMRGQNLAAGGRQLRKRHRRFWLWRRFRRLGVNHRILEPVGEIAGLAALACRWLRLAFAFAAAGRTFDADMEGIIVAVHRPHLGEPAAVAL